MCARVVHKLAGDAALYELQQVIDPGQIRNLDAAKAASDPRIAEFFQPMIMAMAIDAIGATKTLAISPKAGRSPVVM